MKNAYLFIFLILINWACSSTDVGNIIHQERIVETDPIEINMEDMFCLEQVYMKDSLLLLIDRCDSCVFHVYDIKHDSLCYSFGLRGQGPNDFLYPSFLSNANMSDSVYCYDANLCMLESISWNSIKSKENIDVGRTNLSEKIAGSPELTKIGKEYWGTLDYMTKGVYFKYIENEDSLIWIEYPESLLDYSDDLALQSRIAVHPTRKTVVVGMKYYNKLFLYSSDGILQREIQIGDEKIFPMVNSKKNIVLDNSILCCQTIRITENYIYVLLSGWPICESSNEIFTSRILVFDQNLNYQETYKLPHKAISFLVNEESDRLIYTGLENEQCIIGIVFLQKN